MARLCRLLWGWSRLALLTFRPYKHWKKITPTDQTSTLLEIFGGSLPTTKHSGGKYLVGRNSHLVSVLAARSCPRVCDVCKFPLTSRSLHPVMSGPFHLHHSCHHPWFWTNQSRWFWFPHRLFHPPTRYYLKIKVKEVSTTINMSYHR